uniref:Uncharacterized protein n=1 Tax=Setaria viridis TaxID=4556 RepID=A0A4U6UF68_SETVI|nr:hypothetical protein SEVIR_5G088401v2 [Setaria viridis]
MVDGGGAARPREEPRGGWGRRVGDAWRTGDAVMLMCCVRGGHARVKFVFSWAGLSGLNVQLFVRLLLQVNFFLLVRVNGLLGFRALEPELPEFNSGFLVSNPR